MTLSIIGAGFSRTGSLSLKRAIEQLGLGPCWHVLDSTPTTAAQVLRAFSTYPAVDWDQVFDGFNAAVDDPASVFYADIARWSPVAKVILTVRDKNEWYPSAEKLVQLLNAARQANPSSESQEWWDKMLSGEFGSALAQFYQFRDRESVIAAYEQHNAEVRATISAARLLVFDVKQGWRPLCEFLGVPIPDAPFPRANSSADLAMQLTPKPAQH
jgi:hypothetical protein